MPNPKTLKPGAFYWARRRDGGQLTVVEAWGSDTIMLIGNLMCPRLDEANEDFEILDEIEPPQSASGGQGT